MRTKSSLPPLPQGEGTPLNSGATGSASAHNTSKHSTLNNNVDTPPTHISPDHLHLLLQDLTKGLSPMSFCKKHNYPIQAYHNTRNDNSEFDLKVRQALYSLSDNVASRLYFEAMEGNVSAMTSWLKLRPPLDWLEDQEHNLNHSSMEKLSDAELIDLARLRGVEIPSELETNLD